MNGEKRYTVYGSPELERRIGRLVAGVADVVREEVEARSLRALILIGGYGRGEGGVEITARGQRPHNNLDFLLVLEDRAGASGPELKTRLDRRISEDAETDGVGIDISTITVGRLRRSPALVIWYDMRFGHKTILGDASFAPSLRQFQVDRLLNTDVAELLVNRGTLLVLNDLIREDGHPSAESERAVVRHAVKGIIGYGDALLYQLGAYHWSYVEKRDRMAGRKDIPASFRALYLEAAAFRLRPDYRAFALRDLDDWLRRARVELEQVHLRVESLRLGVTALTWEDYPRIALRHGALSELGVPRRAARKIVNLARSSGHPDAGSLREALGYRCAGPHGLLPLAFPVVAYDLPDERYRRLAATVLGTGTSQVELRRAYVRKWGVLKDFNLSGSLGRLGIRLEEAA